MNQSKITTTLVIVAKGKTYSNQEFASHIGDKVRIPRQRTSLALFNECLSAKLSRC